MSVNTSQEIVSAPQAANIGEAVAPPSSIRLSENMPVVVGLVGAIVAILTPIIAIMIWVSSMQADMVDRFAELEKHITTQIQESHSSLLDKIHSLDLRIQTMDNKLNAIGDMTLVAFNDGEIDSGELATIWAQARGSTPADGKQVSD